MAFNSKSFVGVWYYFVFIGGRASFFLICFSSLISCGWIVWINLIRNGSDRCWPLLSIFEYIFPGRKVILFSDICWITVVVFMLISFFGIILSLHNVANFFQIIALMTLYLLDYNHLWLFPFSNTRILLK